MIEWDMLNKMDLIYKPGDVLTGSNKLTDIEKETIPERSIWF